MEAVAKAISFFGRVDILINNAGMSTFVCVCVCVCVCVYMYGLHLCVHVWFASSGC